MLGRTNPLGPTGKLVALESWEWEGRTIRSYKIMKNKEVGINVDQKRH